MPTYTWACPACQHTVEVFLPLSEYCAHKPEFVCCSSLMERRLDAVAIGYVSEDSYKDLRAADGTDISSRSKHREYMRRNNLTTMDDFTEQWKRDAKERQDRLDGVDPSRRLDFERAVAQLEK